MANKAALELPFDASNPHIQKFTKKLLNPVLQRLFLLTKLPSAFFMGIRIQAVDMNQASVTVPYRWSSQNPFKSIYFAAQAAAAEMSTGVLAMQAIQGRGKISMLVVDIKGVYGKKAISKATFVCKDGPKLIQAIEEVILTGESRTVTMESIGTQVGQNGALEEISRFELTWSFKAKK
jgi:hypothetical protein